MADATVAASLVSSSQGNGFQRQLWKVFTAEPVNATAAVDSIIDITNSVLGFSLADALFFGIHAKAASGGTVNVDVKVLLSPDDTAANYVIPDSNGTAGNLADTTAHVFPATPAPMPRMRIRLQGVGSNAATTTVTLYLWIVK